MNHLPDAPNMDALYTEIHGIVAQARAHAYTAINTTMVAAYWNIGRVIVEREQGGAVRGQYGKGILTHLSERLTQEFGKGFDVRNLQQMKKFYLVFPNTNALRSQLSWTHYRILLQVENEVARNWYLEEAIKSGWSSRQLDRQISTLYYERLLASREPSPVIAEANTKLALIKPEAFIKDPYVMEFLNLKNYPSLRETDLESLLLDNLQAFLLELGRGFCFVARQKLMRYENDDFYVDLVFYHSVLKCHVLIDLKVDKLTHADVGQMESYIRMFDDLYKNKDDNPTLGIILCSQKNETIAKYSVLSEAQKIFASKYILELPSSETLQKIVEKERKVIEDGLEQLS